jgi:hypothetical protein
MAYTGNFNGQKREIDNTPQGMIDRAKGYAKKDYPTVVKTLAELGVELDEGTIKRALYKVKVRQVNDAVKRYGERKQDDNSFDAELLQTLADEQAKA